jgi:hypothetical protein
MAIPTLEEGIVEYVREGGFGSEADVRVYLLNKLPGIGGTIKTHEGVVTAVRAEHNPVPGSGHDMFLRHMLIKKIEDYFFRKQVYKYAHIPRPLGSISRQDGAPFEACLYEWAFGSEGFPWEISEYGGEKIPVRLRDWNQFVEHFHEVGINLSADITDPDDGKVSKNIIHQFPVDYPSEGDLSPIWKRIDFGPASAPIDYEKVMRYLVDNRVSLIDIMRGERYQMMLLATKYLDWSTRGSFSAYEYGILETLTGYYRLASLEHHISRGGCNSNGQPYSEEFFPTLFKQPRSS